MIALRQLCLLSYNAASPRFISISPQNKRCYRFRFVFLSPGCESGNRNRRYSKKFAALGFKS